MRSQGRVSSNRLPITSSGLARLGAAAVLLLGTMTPVAAKTPGTTYCYVGVCHRVLTLDETAQQVGRAREVVASYYDVPWRDPFNPSLLTSSGETFRADSDDSAASPIYPDGTRLLVWEPISNGAAVVRVNNAGPYYGDRLLDLSRGAADRLGLGPRGIGRVLVMVLTAPEPAEAAYVAGRVYDPVAGYIGAFPSIEDAHKAWRELPLAQAIAISAAWPARGAALEPPSNRVVVIPAGRNPIRGGARGAKVVLLPVKLRRAPVLRMAAAKKAAASRKEASGRR